MAEGLAHGLDGRAAVLEPLRESGSEDTEIRAFDSGFPETLEPPSPPSRLRVVVPSVVRDEGVNGPRFSGSSADASLTRRAIGPLEDNACKREHENPNHHHDDQNVEGRVGDYKIPEIFCRSADGPRYRRI